MSTPGERCGRRAGAVHLAPASYGQEPELAISALLHLLSRFPARRSPALAQAIADHLRLVGGDPHITQCVRDCAAGLVAEWEAYAVLSDDQGDAAMC
ncbi:MAG: hypothetical protein Q7J47_13420 [Azoarcus sp.]|nr:hypothetical protein [Azoarcus sp.]